MVLPNSIRMRYFFLLLVFAAQTAYGQCCPYLSPVRVLPANPSDTDEVRLVFQASTGNRGNKINSTYARTGNSFAFLGCYFSGMLTQPQSYTDTVSIGRLAPGSYTVSFTGLISSNSQQCVEVQRNSSSMAFQVGGALAVSPGNAGWSVYPVPTTSRTLSLVAPPDATITAVQLLDVAGRETFAGSAASLLPDSGHWRLELPGLAQCSYTLKISLANGRQLMHRVILQ
jgi:hypothetical protein